jgi:PAS domain S-box-containing protein
VLRVLIVDDYEVERRGVRSALSATEGVEICGEAVDGAEAIAKAKELRPDVITMDISMPKLNGLEATREIRRMFPDVHILIVSQHDLPDMMEKAKSAGASAYITKSALSTELVAALDRLRCGGAALPPKAFDRTEYTLDTAQFGATQDVGHRQAVEQALREKARLLDLSSDAIFVRDSADRITFWNEGATEMYGYRREEALGRVSHEFFRTEFPEPLEQIMQTVLREGRWGGELVHRRANGSRITVSSRWSVERDAEGNIAAILETNRDISGQKQAERAQARLAAIVESSDDAIVSKNLDGIIMSWNAGAQRIFGYTPEEAIGQPITIIIPPDLHDEEKQILSRLRAGQRVDHFETIRQTKDGRKRHVALTISPLRDAQGRVIGASKIARDITQRKEAERALRESEERFRALSQELESQVQARTKELRQKNSDLQKQAEQLRELSWRLMHLQDEERRRVARELHDGVGQILAALGMNLSIVASEKQKLSAEAARCVDQNANFIKQAISETRTLSHLLHPPFLDEVGLKSALREYVEGFAERSNIHVTLDLPANLERLPREQELCVFRVVQECLTNIHRHSGSRTARVQLARGADEIRLEVSDQGRGMSPDVRGKFQTGGSSGVGLRGMRERVRQMGGALQVQSNGKGTSVTAVLPIRPQTPSSQEDERLASAPPKPPARKSLRSRPHVM